MTQTQVKEQVNALLDTLPPEQAELVLDFATLLRQRQAHLETALYMNTDAKQETRLIMRSPQLR